MTEYFKELEEESIRDNFVLIYELLDEMLDYGYPQVTNSKILKEYITQTSYKLETPRIPTAVTNVVSWRPDGIKYKKNEVFLDVIESVNLLVSSTGNVIHNEIIGSLKMTVYLSGMPELRLGLNDRILFDSKSNKSIDLEDIRFHECVKKSRFDEKKAVSFVPPDGEFELMSYRMTSQAKPLIWIETSIEKHPHSRIEYTVLTRSHFKKRCAASKVEIQIPVPHDVDSPSFDTSVGFVKYLPGLNAIVWNIKSFPGGKEYVMKACFGLPSIESEEIEKKPPIEVKFQIPYFVSSGVQVRYLKIVEKSGYDALSWVRYITQDGIYHLRI